MKKAPDQQKAEPQEPTQADQAAPSKRKNDYKFFVLLRSKPRSADHAMITGPTALKGFQTKTEINEYLSANPELELAENRVIRGYEKNLKAQTRISF